MGAVWWGTRVRLVSPGAFCFDLAEGFEDAGVVAFGLAELGEGGSVHVLRWVGSRGRSAILMRKGGATDF
jgi:hypothetical protein